MYIAHQLRQKHKYVSLKQPSVNISEIILDVSDKQRRNEDAVLL